MSAHEARQQPGGTPRPSRSARWRDGITFVLAWVIIGWQMLMVAPADVNEAFLVLAGSLLGVPFRADAVARIRGGAGGTPTEPPVSPLPSSDSPA